MISQRLTLSLSLAMLAACSTAPERLSPKQASADGHLRVEAMWFDRSDRPNSMGVLCETEVTNTSPTSLEVVYRMIYFSHTGAELLYPKEAWDTAILETGEHRILRHVCPFRTAKQAKIEIRSVSRHSGGS